MVLLTEVDILSSSSLVFFMFSCIYCVHFSISVLALALIYLANNVCLTRSINALVNE